MAKYTANQKSKLFKKLKDINIVTEKDILNLKVADLKKLKQAENKISITIADIELIWLMQEAIDNKKLLEFLRIQNNKKTGGAKWGK